MKKSILLPLIFLALFPSVHAIQLDSNLFISIPPETIQCIDITLPDDAGITEETINNYLITSDFNWGDLTEQLVKTDSNNTVIVPVCFDSFGKEEGSCSNTYSLSIAIPELKRSKGFHGGVCVSSFPDIDHSTPEKGETPKDVLNSNADVFSIAFQTRTNYLSSGTAEVTLLLESYAAVTLDVELTGIYKKKETVSLSPSSPKASLTFTATNPGEITATATIQGCKGKLCTKAASGSVIGSPRKSGFSATLFPRSLSVKNLDPATFELIITSFGEERTFEITPIFHSSLNTTLQKQSVRVNGKKTIEFQVTPRNASTLYLLSITLASGEDKKEVTASLSTNELLTDTLREAKELKRQNPEKSKEIDETVGNWYVINKNKEYGKDLNDYQEMKQSLKQFNETAKNTTTPPIQPPILPPSNPTQDYSVFIIAGIIAVIALVAIVALKRKPKTVDTVQLDEGF